jgi:hypothetical protein
MLGEHAITHLHPQLFIYFFLQTMLQYIILDTVILNVCKYIFGLILEVGLQSLLQYMKVPLLVQFFKL